MGGSVALQSEKIDVGNGSNVANIAANNADRENASEAGRLGSRVEGGVDAMLWHEPLRSEVMKIEFDWWLCSENFSEQCDGLRY